jgi:hypothetical protein
MIRLASLCLALLVLLTGAAGWTADGDAVKPKDDGYRGIWFTLGQYSDAPYGKGDWNRLLAHRACARPPADVDRID